MKWLDRLSNSRSSVPLSSNSVLSIFGLGTNDINVNPETALKHTTVYTCVNVKAQGLSSIPFTLYKSASNGRKKATKHPLYKVLGSQVNPLMTSVTWREMVVQDLELKGTHFSQIIRNNGGQVVAIYPLNFDDMQVSLNTTATVPTVEYRYKGNILLSDKQVLRIVGLPSTNGILGITPISQNAQSIGLGMQTEIFGSKFFENGANGSGILTTDKVLNADGKEQLSSDFGKKYTGLSNAKKPIVLQDGMKWNPITINNNDSQFLETRQFQKSEIASIFRVSPHLINDLKNATFSNITELSLEHIKFCLMPVANRIENAINTQLLTEKEQENLYIEFNFNGMMRGDFKSRTEGYKNAINGGYMTPNEVRKLENLDIDENVGNKLLMQLGFGTLENIEKTSKEETNE